MSIGVIPFNIYSKSFGLYITGFEARLQHRAVHDADAVIRFVKSGFQNHELIYIGHGISGGLV